MLKDVMVERRQVEVGKELTRQVTDGQDLPPVRSVTAGIAPDRIAVYYRKQKGQAAAVLDDAAQLGFEDVMAYAVKIPAHVKLDEPGGTAEGIASGGTAHRKGPAMRLTSIRHW